MKKLVILLGLMLALQVAMMSQPLTGEVIFNAHLNQTMRILVVTGGVQEITFADAPHYNNGVTEGDGIASGVSNITIEATEDWNTTIECPDFQGTGQTIPIENLGVTIADVGGTNTLAGGQVSYTALTGAPQPLTNDPVALISNANGNAGDATANIFQLHWEMGTLPLQLLINPDDGAAMGSMFSQMSAGDFATGDYTTTAIITLAPVAK